MRKQTKIVAVASAAAILAIGASMTSFAATGWVEENGEWFYYDKDSNKVEDEWKKSGDSWYWLDSEANGAMAIDKLVVDGDNNYYVSSTGKMAANTWVKVANEDQDDEDDPADYIYYYMQSNGKAYKGGDNTKFRTIDGKKYAFNEDGKMLYGWVDENGNRLAGESDWTNATYYLGNWDDGAMKTGWQKAYVYDEAEGEDREYWFNFKSNGKKRFLGETENGNVNEVKINGKRYGFDKRGVMTYEWTLATGSEADRASTSSWKYFNSPEDGARVTKGWFKVIAPTEDNSFGNVIIGAPSAENTFSPSKAEDESEKWYYADGNGNLATKEIKKIKGKYYAFHEEGWMLNGLVLMSVNENGSIKDVWDSSVDGDKLDNIMNNKYTHSKLGNLDDSGNSDVSLYYFGNDEDNDGSLKTGATTVTLDGDSYNFFFGKTGGIEAKGKGISGIDGGKYIYKMGMRLKASSEDKYMVVYAKGDTSADSVEVIKKSSKDFRTDAVTVGKNKDGDSVKWYGKKDKNWGEDYYLINTSGNIQKTKTAAKDGDDWYFYVDGNNIVLYTNNKNLSGTSLEKWKTWK